MWIFGYGSLMWDDWEKPFACKRKAPAILEGYARSFTKASIKNWGSKAAPGPTLRVVAQEGAQCQGIAFEFDGMDAQKALEYLRGREGKGFVETPLPVKIAGGIETTSTTFLYGGNNILAGTDDELAAMAMKAHGTSGHAAQYVVNCREELSAVGISDLAVDRLYAAIDKLWTERQIGIAPAVELGPEKT